MEGEVGFEPTVRVRDGVTARRPFLQNVSPMVGDERFERSCQMTAGSEPAGSAKFPQSPMMLEPAARFELAEIWLRARRSS